MVGEVGHLKLGFAACHFIPAGRFETKPEAYFLLCNNDPHAGGVFVVVVVSSVVKVHKSSAAAHPVIDSNFDTTANPHRVTTEKICSWLT